MQGQRPVSYTHLDVYKRQIPGNLAICLNADFDYVLAKAPNGEVYIVAKDVYKRQP